ncbi:MAG: hypothetical protein IKA62_03600 [Clostridia bacterium]|nr:hypothetical protein [Clostridia bacterium]
MKRILAIALCLVMALAIVACGNANNTETPATEAEYKLGMGVVVDMNSSATGNAQVDATVAAVVTDADGKIVACRIDVAQNKMDVTGGAVDTAKTFQTKMELGDNYNMAKYGQSMDWNGDGVVKEWYDQAKAFEAYVVGKTVAEVEAIQTQVVEGAGYVIAADEALLTAGCTIQITDFITAVAKACKDEQGMSFKTNATFTLGVAANTTVDAATVAATAEADGTVAMYSDMACAVVADGKVIATLNDAIQPKITISAAGEIVETSFKGTKRELKEGYNMAKFGAPNVEGGTVLEWYVQSAAFSNYVLGKTATEIDNMETKLVNNHYISVEEGLLSAGCTMQITGICDVVAKSANNAR